MGQAEQERQNETTSTAQKRYIERDRQNRKYRTGQAAQDRQNRKDGTGQAEQKRENGTGRTGKMERDRQNCYVTCMYCLRMHR
jgi:hypothetical protein